MSLHPVRNMELLSTPVLTEGLVFGTCGCTDIDVSLDWQGKTFIFVELKHGSSPLTAGQKYHLQGLVKAITAGGKRAIAILAHHHGERGDPIMAKDAIVTSVYTGGGMWVKPRMEITLYEELAKQYEEHKNG